ncbi:MAG: ubiquinone biosynthesis accessory factor UbiJ [Burkholderiales bacterium]
MAFVFSLMVFEPPIAAALNHVLEAEPWAPARLAPFSGATLELRGPWLPPLHFAVTAEGRLRPAVGEAPPSLVLSFGPEILPALLRGEDHLIRAVEIAGDSALANEVLFLFRHLRWDAEEDLARVVGDVAAHRLASTARGLLAGHREGFLRTAENLMEYALEERPLVAHRISFEEHRSAVTQLRDAIERLEKRLDRLAG